MAAVPLTLSEVAMRGFGLSTCLLLAIAPAIHAQAAPAAKKWGPAPAALPPGARMTVVSGDPSKAEMFTAELAMPSGYKIPPHFHFRHRYGPVCLDLRQSGGRSPEASRQALSAFRAFRSSASGRTRRAQQVGRELVNELQQPAVWRRRRVRRFRLAPPGTAWPRAGRNRRFGCRAAGGAPGTDRTRPGSAASRGR